MSLTHRLQILLDEERYERVSAIARREGRSVAAVIRDAIDRSLAAPEARRAAAGRRVLAAEPMDVPDVAGLRAELDAERGRRG